VKSSLPTAPFIRVFLRTVTVAALCGCGSAGSAMMPGTTTPAARASLTQHAPGPLVTNLKSFTLSLSKKQILPLLVAKQQNASWGIAVESTCNNMYPERVTGFSPTPSTPGLAIMRYHRLTPDATGRCYWKFIALGSGNRKISVTVRATVTP
jgi:hypothetical protein